MSKRVRARDTPINREIRGGIGFISARRADDQPAEQEPEQVSEHIAEPERTLASDSSEELVEQAASVKEAKPKKAPAPEQTQKEVKPHTSGDEIPAEDVEVMPAKKSKKRTIDIEVDKSIKVTDSKSGTIIKSVHDELHIEVDDEQQGLFDMPSDPVIEQ